MHKARLLITLTGILTFEVGVNALLLSDSPAAAIVVKKDGQVVISTPDLVRTLQVSKQGVQSTSLKVGASELLSGPSHEFRLQIEFASPNRRPKGLKPGEGGVIKQSAAHFPLLSKTAIQ
jgi:hypothetical protein